MSMPCLRSTASGVQGSGLLVRVFGPRMAGFQLLPCEDCGTDLELVMRCCGMSACKCMLMRFLFKLIYPST